MYVYTSRFFSNTFHYVSKEYNIPVVNRIVFGLIYLELHFHGSISQSICYIFKTNAFLVSDIMFVIVLQHANIIHYEMVLHFQANKSKLLTWS